MFEVVVFSIRAVPCARLGIKSERISDAMNYVKNEQTRNEFRGNR